MPSFFSDGNTPRREDPRWRILQKILGATIDGPGGSGGIGGTTNLALAGAAPPTDGSVETFRVFDTDEKYSWYNSGTIASPVWFNT